MTLMNLNKLSILPRVINCERFSTDIDKCSSNVFHADLMLSSVIRFGLILQGILGPKLDFERNLGPNRNVEEPKLDFERNLKPKLHFQ